MIVGHGIDLIEIHRIREMVRRHGDHFLSRVFTHAELEYCAKSPKRYFEHLAGRFAAKEAVLKALGTGWSGGIAWTDIQILANHAGRPEVQLNGHCSELANKLGVSSWQLSISHISTHATASAIAVGTSDKVTR